MDRNTVTGLILIFLITMAWAFYTMPSEAELQRQRAEQALQDSIAAAQAEEQRETDIPAEVTERPAPEDVTERIERERDRPAFGLFDDAAVEDTVFATVRTPLYEIEFTNLGAGPAKYTLLGHKTWDQRPVQMIADTSRSAYSLGFLSAQNYNIETDQLLFEPLFDETLFDLDLDESATISYQLVLDDNARLVFTYTFYADQYSYELDIHFDGIHDFIGDPNVDFGWRSPLNLTERDVAQDARETAAHIYAGGVLEKFQLSDAGRSEQRINGTIDWVSSKTRFFGQFIKPVTASNAAILIGELDGPPNDAATLHHYQVAIQSSITNTNTLSYELYSGPLRYYDLLEFHPSAYDVVEIGYALIRWFADPLVRWIIIPFFALGSTIIPNYGWLIILFGVIVKLVLFPLTQKSFKSMAAMKELQPKMQEIKEKYKDDPQKQQKETIALYKKEKVNPIGGCLPMLLQFPILITLFFFFQNSMLIRQEPFLWASDLSAPDYILSLPFAIPLLGDQIAGFVLLMTGAMFLQMKVTGGMSSGPSAPGAPNMKAFQYILPFVLLFVFNNFAAGLSLYYLVYNVLSAGQQFIINKQIKKPEGEEDTSGKKQRKSIKGKGKKKK